MGTPGFAAASLEKLICEGYEIPLVLTRPDARGNRNKIVLSPVKSLALDSGIEVAQPERLRKSTETVEKIRELAPDMIVVAAFGQILPESILEIPRYGCINVHGSLLPHLRGASPMQTAVLEGLDESGVTIMRMDRGLDTGDMISKTVCDIKGKDITEVTEILAKAGSELLADTLPRIADGSAVFEKQDDSEASYAGMIKKSDGFTDFNEAADIIERKIRAFMEWPSCYTYLNGLQLKLYRAEALMTDDPDGPPGTVCAVDKTSYTINCRSGKLTFLELQLQGRKRMSAGDFLRGHRLSAGDRFCK